jgi:hypothetical protein
LVEEHQPKVNPSAEEFAVAAQEGSRYSLLTLQGAVLMEGVITEQNTAVQWPVSAVEGMYLLRIQTTEGSSLHKLMRQR